MIHYRTIYAIIVLICTIGVSNVVLTCPTCLAHLKRGDKPFFIREISAQIAATQATVAEKTAVQAKVSKQAKKNTKLVAFKRVEAAQKNSSR